MTDFTILKGGAPGKTSDTDEEKIKEVPIYTCNECILFRNCTELCDKLRHGKQLVEFINKFYCCPDCGGDILQSEDGRKHWDFRYQQCKECKHFFCVNDDLELYYVVQKEISGKGKLKNYQYKDIDRSGH